MTELRAFLYPFGFLAYAAFGARFLLQWMQSEHEKKSVTPVVFWRLSLIGNILLFTHCLIQVHYPMCIAQGINGVLAWRNINLEKAKPAPIQHVFLLLFAVLALTSTLFSFEGIWVPTPNWLHFVGIIGIFCHSVRFWQQWWHAECNKTSSLTTGFWWLSFIGAILCSIYFFMLQDWVNFIAPTISLIPFGRNLWLIHQQKETA